MLSRLLTTFLCASFAWSVLIDDQPYCAVRYRRLCQGKGRHVACQFPVPGPGTSCRNYTQIRFTSELKHFIVHYINRRRQRIASGNERVRGGAHLPRPEVMMMVAWDRELALLAQRLADQCHFVHDDCRATVRYPYAGQTVGEVRWRRSSESDELSAQRAIRRVFDAWWGERRRVQPKQLTMPFRLTAKGTVWGHFSQIAVWTLQAVGCGAVRHGAEHPRLLLVCDFSHTNMLGQRTLTPGPMAPCPMHTARRSRSPYPLLCGPVRHHLAEPDDPGDKNDDAQYDDMEKDDPDVYDEGMTTTKERRTSQRPLPAPRLEKKHRPDQYERLIDKEDFSLDPDEESPIQAFKAPEKVTTTIVEKLQRELVDNKKEKVTLNKMFDWRSRSTTPVNFPNESWENGEEMTTAKIRRMKSNPEEEVVNDDLYHATRIEDTTTPEMTERQRWKPTRERPQRPGANALLSKVPEKAMKPTASSLKLDSEDQDQLFRDTGFNAQWRQDSKKT
ncbi:uncharacterized protein LOC106712285 [Papilio machaon]|uniref:uncharacterized protein LOC106712285 n=1 Tax=Papilio machaon TaxID=76193 RepID=UPI001E664DB4|nr:uncharacterized protein LOC106712285 [Papilio machaon]